MKPLNIITLATLFPNAEKPNFGIFVERQTAEIASRDGINLTVINPIGIPPFPLSLLAPYRSLKALPLVDQWNGMTVYRPRFLLIPKYGVANNPSLIYEAVLPILRQIHEETPIDLIDAEFFYPDGPAAMQLAEALDVPFTVKARGADIHYWGHNPSTGYQVKEAGTKASGLLAVSQAIKEDMVGLDMDANKITVHYTGLDQEKFKPLDRTKAKAEWGVEGRLIVSVGALIERKNQDLIINAMPHLPDCTLVLAGSGEEEQNYRKLAHKLGVSSRVGFAGNVPHDKLPSLLGAADVMVLASKSEGLANAWVEALACGTPIVISEAGGARELLKDKAAGRVVAQNSTAIADAVQSILDNPQTQENVRKSVQQFSWKTNGDNLHAFFKTVTNSAK